MSGKVVLVSSDVMLWARVRDVARALEVEVARCDDEAGLEGAWRSGGVRRVLVDLEAAGLDLASWAARFKALDPPPELVGYGSHVHDAALDAARRSGFDRVLTRGVFHRSVGDLLGS